jgi:hypothetical protein
MVSFDQRVVLSPETQDRADKLLDLFNAINQKFPDISSSFDGVAATNLVKSVENIVTNSDPILRHIDGLIEAVQAFAIIMTLLMLLLTGLVVVGTFLCYLLWKRGGKAKTCIRCQCGSSKADEQEYEKDEQVDEKED